MAGTHVREHTSVLADAEKRLLVWLARRIPAWINSDHLTALGAAAMVATGAAFAAASVDRRALFLVPALLAVNWFGDSLDGTVARVRGHQRPRYGYYLDHVVDLTTTTALFAGMAISGLMQPMLATLVLLGYVLLCAESFLATHTVGIFRLAFSGMGPTELRILLAVGALVATDPAHRVGGGSARRAAFRRRRGRGRRGHGRRVRAVGVPQHAGALPGGTHSGDGR